MILFDWCKVYIHLTSLNIRHFVLLEEATESKSMAIDDGALHFGILFIRTLSIVQFNKITTFQRVALSPSSGDKRERGKGERAKGM
jgi:hypothetical protein